MRTLIDVIVKKKYSHVCIIGDFNYPTINWKTWSPGNDNEDSEEYKFIDCLRDNHPSQHITRPTRVRGTDEPSTLDLLITNDEKMIPEIHYLSPLGKSDHATLLFDLACYSVRKSYITKKYYYDKADYTAMKRYLQSIDWGKELDNTNDINQMWDCFMKHFKPS